MYDNFKDIPQFLGASYGTDVPFDYLAKQLTYFKTNYKLLLDPDFQRDHVWSEDQQSRYIEFCLRGGTSARDIYFNGYGFSAGTGALLELVDGKQRITAVSKFMDNQIKAFGKFLYEYTGKLPPLLSLRFNINELKTRAEVLQWYIDINDGGVVHSQEEIQRVRELLKNELR